MFTGGIPQHITQTVDECGIERSLSVKRYTVPTALSEILAERRWDNEALTIALGVSASTIEKLLALGFSPCVSTLSNTCAPLGFEVMLVPTGTQVEKSYVITE